MFHTIRWKAFFQILFIEMIRIYLVWETVKYIAGLF